MSEEDGSAVKNKKKRRYNPHSKPVKKGQHPLAPGVQGFLITCDGGRERQAFREAISVLETFLDNLIGGSDAPPDKLQKKALNRKTTFTYPDDSDADDVEQRDPGQLSNAAGAHICKTDQSGSTDDLNPCHENEKGDGHRNNVNRGDGSDREKEDGVPQPPKKMRVEKDSAQTASESISTVSIDKLIEDEIRELGDTEKRRFIDLDTGCNGVIFIQMRKIAGDPCPSDLAHHMMTTVETARKQISRFLLRVLPIEASSYASEDKISIAMGPIVEKYFPANSPNPQKFAVLYEARANTGIERMKIIDVVAKLVPGPHKVDLNNPDKTIIVEIVKSVCLIGVVEKYKQLAKYNLRQLTAPKS